MSNEKKALLNRIDSKKWPNDMQTPKENVLRTTMSDEKRNYNDRKDSDVPPSISNGYKRLSPANDRLLERHHDNTQRDDTRSALDRQPYTFEAGNHSKTYNTQSVGADTEDEKEFLLNEEEKRKRNEDI